MKTTSFLYFLTTFTLEQEGEKHRKEWCGMRRKSCAELIQELDAANREVVVAAVFYGVNKVLCAGDFVELDDDCGCAVPKLDLVNLVNDVVVQEPLDDGVDLFFAESFFVKHNLNDVCGFLI